MNEHQIDPFIDCLAREGDPFRGVRAALATMVVALHNATCLNNYLRHQIDAYRHTPKINASAIIARVCVEFGVSVRQMRGDGRQRNLSAARQAACVRLADAGFSCSESGRLLNIDRTSVITALKRAKGWRPPSRRAPRSDLWGEAECAVAKRLAYGSITTTQAVELLKPRRSRESILRKARTYKEPRP